jgi:hypothetical protein
MPLPPTSVPLSWDRAIGLVDMALYMAKVNGRNRAYGLKRLMQDDDEALAAAERDLEHAWKSGLVEMQVTYGPSPASGANERSVRDLLTRASRDLNRVDYMRLSTDSRAQYEQSKRFSEQAEQALKERNLIFAATLADKAATLAAELLGK